LATSLAADDISVTAVTICSTELNWRCSVADIAVVRLLVSLETPSMLMAFSLITRIMPWIDAIN